MRSLRFLLPVILIGAAACSGGGGASSHAAATTVTSSSTNPPPQPGPAPPQVPTPPPQNQAPEPDCSFGCVGLPDGVNVTDVSHTTQTVHDSYGEFHGCLAAADFATLVTALTEKISLSDLALTACGIAAAGQYIPVGTNDCLVVTATITNPGPTVVDLPPDATTLLGDIYIGTTVPASVTVPRNRGVIFDEGSYGGCGVLTDVPAACSNGPPNLFALNTGESRQVTFCWGLKDNLTQSDPLFTEIQPTETTIYQHKFRIEPTPPEGGVVKDTPD